MEHTDTDEDLAFARQQQLQHDPHDHNNHPMSLSVAAADPAGRSQSSAHSLQPKSILASGLNVRKDSVVKGSGRRASFAAAIGDMIKAPAALMKRDESFEESEEEDMNLKAARAATAKQFANNMANNPQIIKTSEFTDATQADLIPQAAMAADDIMPVKSDKYRSKQSVGSTGSQLGGRGAREISETLSGKLYEMKWCFLAIIINAGLIVLFDKLRHSIQVTLSQDVLVHYGAVVVEIILLLSNIISIKAMDDGFQAYFGNKIATVGGSMALCGFSQTSSLFKLGYSGDLSLNSGVRKTLVRLSYGWILVELLKLTTPFPATALSSQVLAVDSGTSDCIVYTQEGVPVDRNWPTLTVEAGIAELIFGTALGVLRSESSEDLNATTIYISPQLVGAVNNGDTISGQGFRADIVTECLCTPGSAGADFAAIGVPQEFADDIADRASNLSLKSTQMAMITALKQDTNATSINITSVMINTSSCGGYGIDMYPVCQTVISNHYHAIVECEYMTDGTPASIAPKAAHLRETLEPASMDWMYQAFLNLFEGQVTSFNMAPTVPGMLNPLLYWTSTDLLAINPSYFAVGFETMFGILMRAAVQRTYGHEGSRCIRHITVPDESLLAIELYGAQFAFTALIIQLIFSVGGAVAFIPWLRNNAPVGPAIRAVKEGAYFTTMLADSNFSDNIRGLCNAPTYAIWQGLDVVVRVGESVESVEDEVGHITMDKKKLVRPLVNGRKYQ